MTSWQAPSGAPTEPLALVISPSAASHVEPEEEADADAAEAAAMAAVQSLENRKLRRELESLRALAHWQQSEVVTPELTTLGTVNSMGQYYSIFNMHM